MFTHAAGALGSEYKNLANESLVIAVQIEHPNAVEEIDAILAEDIDVAFVRVDDFISRYPRSILFVDRAL